MFKKILLGTLISVLTFCTVSFITVLKHINSAVCKGCASHKFEIGFPFKYFTQLNIDTESIVSSWNIKFLILDFSIVSIIIIPIVLFLLRKIEF